MPLLMKLFKSVLRKEICTIDAAKMAEPAYRETVFMEFMIKRRAMSCLKTFLTLISNIRAESNKTALRQISGMVCHAVSFFLNQGDKQDIDKLLHKQFGTNQIQGAKADLFACLIKLPQESFSSKYVTLLHPIVEIIIQEDGGPFKIPSIYKHLLSREDSHISPSVTQPKNKTTTKQSKKQQASEDQSLAIELEMDTRGCIWGVQDISEYSRLLNAIRVKDFIQGAAIVPIQDFQSCYPR